MCCVFGRRNLPPSSAEARRWPALLPPDDLDLLKGIRSLLYSDGLTIKGVQKICANRVRATSWNWAAARQASSFRVARNDEAAAREEARDKPSNVHRFRAIPGQMAACGKVIARTSPRCSTNAGLKARLRSARRLNPGSGVRCGPWPPRL